MGIILFFWIHVLKLIANLNTAISTQTRFQTKSVLVDGEITFTRHCNEIPNSNFRAAWLRDGIDLIPRVLKFCPLSEYETVLRISSFAIPLREYHLAEAVVWGNPSRRLHVGILTPRYSGVLSEFCNEITLPTTLVMKCLVQIEMALQKLHEFSLVHCDVKPSNIFIDNCGDFFLGDYGSVTRRNDAINSYTPSFSVHGCNLQSADFSYDWRSYVIMGLVLLRKLPVQDSPISQKLIADSIHHIRGDTDPAHRKLTDVFDGSCMM